MLYKLKNKNMNSRMERGRLGIRQQTFTLQQIVPGKDCNH